MARTRLDSTRQDRTGQDRTEAGTGNTTSNARQGWDWTTTSQTEKRQEYDNLELIQVLDYKVARPLLGLLYIVYTGC